jgi:hypothetical protein
VSAYTEVTPCRTAARGGAGSVDAIHSSAEDRRYELVGPSFTAPENSVNMDGIMEKRTRTLDQCPRSEFVVTIEIAVGHMMILISTTVENLYNPNCRDLLRTGPPKLEIMHYTIRSVHAIASARGPSLRGRLRITTD